MMVVACRGDDIWHERTNDEAPVDHGIGKKNEPAMSRPGFQFTSGFGAAHTTSRILPTDSDADEKAPSRQNIEHANNATMVVGATRERCEDDEDDR